MMMQDNQITISGYVGTAVEFRDQNGPPWAMFRVGSTPRYFDRQFNAWRDLETTWVTVKATRDLAQNIADSLKVGEPVLVTGKLRTQVWESKEGESRRSEVLHATAVCHDLNRGTSAFQRVDRTMAPPTPTDSDDVAVIETLDSQTRPAA
ncbi:MAG: single-stranded DNA-binding protein [Propionibacteriales bacterium]|nr:single-stranded DNA-binding protein [Propionibacteriales bacterium]